MSEEKTRKRTRSAKGQMYDEMRGKTNKMISPQKNGKDKKLKSSVSRKIIFSDDKQVKRTRNSNANANANATRAIESFRSRSH